MTRTSILLILMGLSFWATAQSTLRGNVYDESTGDPVAFATVFLEGTNYNASTDLEGFFNISGIASGNYTLIVKYVGYADTKLELEIPENRILNQQMYLREGIDLATVDVSARRDAVREQVKISSISVSSEDINLLPSAGGEPDIAQYLTVLPGVVFTGDQGGQLYIRGGSPVQNKVLLDGMTIYNPFHSIGFFSVFETDIIRNVDVLSGGFGAEHGGRISAIVDITTREGNKTRYGGVISGSPFQAKVLVEGPLKKWQGPGTGSASFILTGKRSYLNETSKSLYSYIDEDGLPYSFQDVYGKLSIVSGNGSKFNVFGFTFTDDADFMNVSEIDWSSSGGGMNFSVLPRNSNFIIEGLVTYSKYESNFTPLGQDARTSGIDGLNIGLNFKNFGPESELNYGFDVNAFSTDFAFVNVFGNSIEENNNTTELSAYTSYRQKIGNLILDPSIRLQYYASLNTVRFEPRFGMKYNISDNFRFKLAGGFYSQNLISTVSERDIVNLFVGFLAGPEEQIFRPGEGNVPADNKLQTSRHAIAGFEIDLPGNLFINIEPYFKDYNQLIGLNRNKLRATDSNYQIETGQAYGIDFSAEKSVGRLSLRGTYSLAKVERDDGEQVYPTNFDRRHNVNALASYRWGMKDAWEFSVRWNYGSGFPFTLTQGFYGNFNFADGISTDVLRGNPPIDIIYSDRRNDGRLPDYHRMDMSLKRKFYFSENTLLTAIGSVTNVYDRENIFYFDRVRQVRVNQLPILPSIGLRFEW